MVGLGVQAAGKSASGTDTLNSAGQVTVFARRQDAYAVAMLRYRGGLSGYLEALQVEDRLLVARLGVSNLAAEARALDIALIRALGGGFASENHSPAKEAIDG